jgi:hypothetical protein
MSFELLLLFGFIDSLFLGDDVPNAMFELIICALGVCEK